jgi:hypothetical protein
LTQEVDGEKEERERDELTKATTKDGDGSVTTATRRGGQTFRWVAAARWVRFS